MFKPSECKLTRTQIENLTKFHGEREEEPPGVIKFQGEVREYIHKLEKFPYVSAFWFLLEPNHDINIEEFDEEANSCMKEDFLYLVEKCMTEICGALDHQTRMLHASFLYTLVHSVHKLRFGEDLYTDIQKTADNLISKLVIVKRPEGVPVEELNFVADFDLNVRASDVFSYAYIYKDVNTLEDQEWRATYGKTCTPTELKVARMIHDRAQGLNKVFEYKMFDLLDTKCHGKWFKANCKAFDRIKEKLKQLAEENKQPAFNGLMDCLRCRASFENIHDLQDAYDLLNSNYKIIRVKNKLNSQLSNLTINFVYEKLIVEMQLVHGTIASELESHTLYEISRCQNIQELCSVIRHWGGYLSEGGIFFYSESRFIDTRPLRSSYTFERLKFIEGPSDPEFPVSYRLIRSKEYGNFDVKGEEWQDEITLKSLETQNIIIEYANKLIYSATMNQSSQGPNPDKKFAVSAGNIHEQKDFVTKISGSYNQQGITSLLFESKDPDFQVASGKAQEGDKTFETAIPEGYFIVGLGGKRSANGLMSIYCWFGSLKEFFELNNVFYEIRLKNGEAGGEGIRVDKDSRYEGSINSELHVDGKGAHYYNTGNFYVGDWKNGKREGKGIMYWADGNRYEGEWKNNSPEGMGTRFSITDVIYSGEFKNGMAVEYDKEQEKEKELEAQKLLEAEGAQGENGSA